MPAKKISGVYEIVNLKNGKRYVGASVDVHDRYRHHINSLRRGDHHCKQLQRDWNRHGERNFEFQLVRRCYSNNRLLLDKRELARLCSVESNKLYNANPTAVTMFGFKHSTASRKKMSAWQVGSKASTETRAKMSAAHKGKQYTLGYKHDAAFRKKRRAYMLVNNPNDDSAVLRKKSIKMKAWWARRKAHSNAEVVI